MLAELFAEELIEAQRGPTGQDQRVAVVQKAATGEVANGALDRVARGESVLTGAELADQVVEGYRAGVEGEDVLQDRRLGDPVVVAGLADVLSLFHGRST